MQRYWAAPVKSAVLALFLLLAGFIGMAMAVAPTPPKFPSAPLTITTKAGTVHSFTVEVAVNDAQREYGLMFRTEMAADHGMIFDFQQPQTVRMWMENTVLPLDMLFLDAGGTVTHIVENAVPYSQTIINSNGPVTYVIELNGGIVKKLGLNVGDKVSSPSIGKH
jgi:uncharacterized membrane protein (UPF0127 family)